MSTETINNISIHFPRVMHELCELVGFKSPELLLKGGKLRIDDYRVSFHHGSGDSFSQMLVYIDMGESTADNKEDAYKLLLKINFNLLAGTRGLIGMHPETSHIFYAFPYTLNDASSGRNLLDLLIRFIGDVGIEALRLPQEIKQSNGAAAVAGRGRAARIIEGTEKKK